MSNLVILSHLGMGDMIGVIPAVRYFCSLYSTVYIFSKESSIRNVKTMYSDLHNLKIISIDSNLNPSREVAVVEKTVSDLNIPECKILRSGIYKNSNNYQNLPDNFYLDLGVDFSVYDSYFKLPEEQLKDYSYLLEGKDFYFVNGTSSTKNIDGEILSKLDIGNNILINPNNNLYTKENVNWDLAEKFVGLPLFDYVTTIRKAKEIHVIDSAFSLLSKFVSIDSTRKYIYNRSGYTLSPSFFRGWEVR
jgi:hypothetical protein